MHPNVTETAAMSLFSFVLMNTDPFALSFLLMNTHPFLFSFVLMNTDPFAHQSGELTAGRSKLSSFSATRMDKLPVSFSA